MTNDLRFIESLGDACFVVDAAHVVVAANAPAERLYARPLQEMIGSPVTALAPPEERDGLLAQIASCNGSPRQFRAVQATASGSQFVGEFTAKSCHLGAPGTVFLLVREACSDDSRLIDDLALGTLMLNHVRDGMVCHTLDGELVFANRAALDSWGILSLEDAQRLGPFGWVSTEARDQVKATMKTLRRDRHARFESHGQTPGGIEAHVEISAALVESVHGDVVVSSVRDITERLEAEEMVRYLAYHDMLTGLANRVLLESDLAHAIGNSDRHEDLLGVIFIDLNDFKPVNDTHGHMVGDQVLREVADRLVGAIRESDTVARTGGDEFVVVLPRLSAPDALDVVARKLTAEIARPMRIDGVEIVVTASLGSALHKPGEDAESVLTRADHAMYQARDGAR